MRNREDEVAKILNTYAVTLLLPLAEDKLVKGDR
jgi:hypothetical protein